MVVNVQHGDRQRIVFGGAVLNGVGKVPVQLPSILDLSDIIDVRSSMLFVLKMNEP